jgi:hypothetical protein
VPVIVVVYAISGLLFTTDAAWAYGGYGFCNHDSGTYSSSGCIDWDGINPFTDVHDSPAHLLQSSTLGNLNDQERWRVSIFSGTHFAEVGLENFYNSAVGQIQLVAYSLYVDSAGHGHFSTRPPCGSPLRDSYYLEDFYYAVGSWKMIFEDQNNSACNYTWSSPNINMDGAAIVEGGSVFVPGSGGSISDGSSMGTYNLDQVSALQSSGQSWDTWGPLGDPWFINDLPCGAAPCLNGAFYGGPYGLAGWSSNFVG